MARLELEADGVGRGALQELAQLLDELAVVGGELAIGEAVADGADAAGACQEREEPGGEAGVAGIDGVLRVADQMREAELVAAGGEALLPAVAVEIQ